MKKWRWYFKKILLLRLLTSVISNNIRGRIASFRWVWVYKWAHERTTNKSHNSRCVPGGTPERMRTTWITAITHKLLSLSLLCSASGRDDYYFRFFLYYFTLFFRFYIYLYSYRAARFTSTSEHTRHWSSLLTTLPSVLHSSLCIAFMCVCIIQCIHIIQNTIRWATTFSPSPAILLYTAIIRLQLVAGIIFHTILLY